jgi:signal transduction histidine kinase
MTTTRHWREALLPGELQQTPDGRRSARDWIVDGTMCLVAILVGALAIGDTWDQRSVTVKFLDIGLGVAGLVALWWRRSRPGAVGAFTAGLTIFSGAAAGPGLIAGFNVALRGTRNEILTVVGITAIAVSVYNRMYPNEESYLLNLFIGALVTAVVIGWGLFVRVRREQFLALRERAAQLEAEQQLHIEHARDAERRRIAREMHDVLAHRVSLLSLHAGALEFRRDASPEEIAEAAGVIRETARAALEDLRQVIGVLRDGSPEGDAPEPPQPTLADVPALVEESRAAGMRVSCHIVVDREVPPALGRTVYRIVQEGLTNARKHAPAAAVDVRIGGGERVSVAIVSRRPVGVAVATAPLPGAGSGLIGLSERVALAGGELEHGPDAAGDFVLRATLPWTTA